MMHVLPRRPTRARVYCTAVTPPARLECVPSTKLILHVRFRVDDAFIRVEASGRDCDAARNPP
jgi:hypothetical protein